MPFRTLSIIANGTVFKRLTVLGLYDAARDPGDSRRRSRYLCECECGKRVVVRGDFLRGGETGSCGCLRRERAIENVKPAYKSNFAEGTNIPSISATEPQKNNKSGIRGVSWYKSRQKWVARITFKGRNYFLGSFANIEDAARIRKEAEEKLFGEFLEWYNGMR